MTNEEFEALATQAETDLAAAKTKEDVSEVWKKYYLTLGHKAMGRLLVGKTAAELAERRA